jgi:uncharacterized protein YcfJ
MSQQDNFAGGFFLGAVMGGILGGVIGALATAKLKSQPSGSDTTEFGKLSDDLQRNLADATTEERMEIARRGLEDKIAQLNSAIEDVRSQMGSANGHPEVLSRYDQPTRLDS